LGKSGYLPDVSSQFAFWREYAVNSLVRKDYDGARAGLYNLNQCLTDEYLIKISTGNYNKLMRNNTVFQCNHCTMIQKITTNKGEEDESIKEIIVPTEIHFSKVEFFYIYGSSIESLIYGHQKIEVWACPKCKNVNQENNNEWNVIKPIREKPFSLGVVPDPPIRLPGLSNRMTFKDQFQGWFYNFLEEIQASMVKYRIEYVTQNNHEMEDSGYRDKGDSNAHN